MPKTRPHTLISTVGTSLFYPNLAQLPEKEQGDPVLREIAAAYTARDWQGVARGLLKLNGADRTCGAEINSVTDMFRHGYVNANEACLIFCHSMTEEGRNIATILSYYYRSSGNLVETMEIEGLQDTNPKVFRTKGLRNLAKAISKIIRERGADFCAINATGGYKAQIAIAVLLGQAIRVPVYYKHERFDEIIAFPPMPVSLDFSLWMDKSGIFTVLDRQLVAESQVTDDWDQRLEALVERVEIDGVNYLELNPTGQVFHESFRDRFWSDRDRVLPPPALRKKKSLLGDHDWSSARQSILAFMDAVMERPYVSYCRTHYWNPDLALPTFFHLKGEEIEGIFSNGTWTVKIKVETSAISPGHREACVADLNGWLVVQKF